MRPAGLLPPAESTTDPDPSESRDVEREMRTRPVGHMSLAKHDSKNILTSSDGCHILHVMCNTSLIQTARESSLLIEDASASSSAKVPVAIERVN